MNNNLLEIKDLKVLYKTRKGNVEAVNGISLQVGAGETVGLVGETGAGKTTTALSILRLVPDPPGVIAGGEIFFDGANLLELSDNDMRSVRGKEISMIFQDPMTALNPIMTIGQQIIEVVLLHENVNRAEARAKASEMLEMVGIPSDRIDEYPHQFSGGMRQRVVIAIALACNPRLLIADEPTTALDVTIQAQVLEMITELKDTLGTSLLLITHDLGIVAEICEKVAIMYSGEIIEMGTVEAIYDTPKHPYTIGLFGAIPNLDEDRDRLTPIEGLMPDPTELPEGCKFASRCPQVMESCRSGSLRKTIISEDHFVRCRLYEKDEVNNGYSS